YDQFMGRYSSRMSAQMADLAGVREGLCVLDVGCGPGALTTELVTRTGSNNVAAVDPSASFVKAVRDRLPGVEVRLGAAGQLACGFGEAGLEDVETTVLAADLDHPSFESWWGPFEGGVGPAGAYVAGLPPERQLELRERCRAVLPDGPFTIVARAWAARGVA